MSQSFIASPLAAVAGLLARTPDPIEHVTRVQGRRTSRGKPGAKTLRRFFEAAHGKGHRKFNRANYQTMAAWYNGRKDGKYKAGHRRRDTGQPVKFNKPTGSI